MLSVLQLTFALFVSVLAVIILVAVPLLTWGLGVHKIIGIERWHRDGAPWNLNITLALVWVILWPCFVIAVGKTMPIEIPQAVGAFISSLYPAP